MSYLDTLIAHLAIWSIKRNCGCNCKTKDYEDFPEIKQGLNAEGRCPECKASEVVEWLEEYIKIIWKN